MLIQPYLQSVEGHGERALVSIDGAFTHAVRKTPRFAADVEVVSEALPITADERAVAERALAAALAGAGGGAGVAAHDLLYARVDVARDARGQVVVMELELRRALVVIAIAACARALRQRDRGATGLTSLVATAHDETRTLGRGVRRRRSTAEDESAARIDRRVMPHDRQTAGRSGGPQKFSLAVKSLVGKSKPTNVPQREVCARQIAVCYALEHREHRAARIAITEFVKAARLVDVEREGHFRLAHATGVRRRFDRRRT
jgi:hypothetical protein